MDVDYRAEAAKSKNDKLKRMMGPESTDSEAGRIAREEETRPSNVDKKTKVRKFGGAVKDDKKSMARMDKKKRARGGATTNDNAKASARNYPELGAKTAKMSPLTKSQIGDQMRDAASELGGEMRAKYKGQFKRARGGSVKTGELLNSKVHSGGTRASATPRDMSPTERGLRGMSPVKKVESKPDDDKGNNWLKEAGGMLGRKQPTLNPEKRANGGRVKGGKGTTVNIVMPQAPGGAPAGGPPPVMLPPAPNPIGPPPGAMPPGGPPMGAGPGPAGTGPMAARPPMGGGMPGAPGMRKRGGRVELTAGAGSGLGRLQKTAAL